MGMHYHDVDYNPLYIADKVPISARVEHDTQL